MLMPHCPRLGTPRCEQRAAGSSQRLDSPGARVQMRRHGRPTGAADPAKEQEGSPVPRERQTRWDRACVAHPGGRRREIEGPKAA